MMRETLDPGSEHAMMIVTPGNGAALQYHTTTGGISEYSGSSAGVARLWVRLSRSGSTFTAYRSTDGNAWTPAQPVAVHRSPRAASGPGW